jgi:uncharacterized protein (DUF1501 family)
MLSIFDSAGPQLSRRRLLTVGSLGMAGLALPQLLAAKARAGGAGHKLFKGRSVVLLWLGGGPSQIETFDPKMTAPSNIRSVTGEVKTTLPGVTFGGTFPLLAERAKKLAIIRNLGHSSSDHNSAMRIMSCGLPVDAEEKGLVVAQSVPGKFPMMWEMVSRIRGSTHPTTGLPTGMLIAPKAVAGDKGKGLGDGDKDGALGDGALGDAYKAFNPAGRGELLQNMRLSLPVERLDDRRGLLSKLDTLRRDLDARGAMSSLDTYRQQAVDVVLGGASKAFDLTQEDPATLAAYDTGEFEFPANLPEQLRRGNAVAWLGKQMLMARRLVEAGAGFVKVLSGGWDNHGDDHPVNKYNNVANVYPVLGNAVDKAASAFIDDCERRGLRDKVLLVITGEIGRTPVLGPHAGRDHWGSLVPVALYGGGLTMGQVIGQSDRRAAFPAGSAYTPQDLLATIMHTLFDLGQLRLVPGLPTDMVQRIIGTPPIPELV